MKLGRAAETAAVWKIRKIRLVLVSSAPYTTEKAQPTPNLQGKDAFLSFNIYTFGRYR